MKAPILCAALAALLSVGCSNPLLDYTEDVKLEFTASQLPLQPTLEPELTFTGGDGQVLVEGRLSTPSPCQELTAEAAGEGRRLRLTVRVNSRPVLCAAVIGRFTYTARLLELRPGTYDVEVVHEYPGTGWGRFHSMTQVTVR